MPLETRVIKHLIRGFLLTQPTVVTLVSDRIYGARLADADVGTIVYPAVVFDLLSGSSNWGKAVQAQTLEIYGYSKESGDEASEVYDAVYNILQHERMTLANVTTKALAFEVQRPVDGFNPVTRAWFSRGRWQVSST